MTIDIYNPETWMPLKLRRQQLRDIQFDLVEPDPKVESELRDVERAIARGETYEVPW